MNQIIQKCVGLEIKTTILVQILHRHFKYAITLVFCVVFSGIEYSGCVMNMNQLKVVSPTEPDQSDHSENEANADRGKAELLKRF